MLEIDGCELHVEGSGSGPGVLLVHGTAANLWGDLPEMLTSDHRVVTYDRRSFGRSTNAPLANLRRHTQDAAVFSSRSLRGRAPSSAGASVDSSHSTSPPRDPNWSVGWSSSRPPFSSVGHGPT